MSAVSPALHKLNKMTGDEGSQTDLSLCLEFILKIGLGFDFSSATDLGEIEWPMVTAP